MIKLDRSFFDEEVRCGFKVTEKRKKCWAVMMNLLHEFDVFAKKYSLEYFVGYGTLLGAIRHKGFVPWDDDIDIVMKRDEYMRMEECAKEYFNGREIGGRRLLFENAYTENAALISYIAKIRDCETTIAEGYMINNGTFSGMSMDIFPLDAVSDGTNGMMIKSRMRGEMWLCFVYGQNYEMIFQQLFGGQSILGDDVLKKISNLDRNNRMKMFENFTLSMWGKSEVVGNFMDNLNDPNKKNAMLTSWQEVKYLPFENMMVPVPNGWEEILQAEYGDYHKIVIGGSDHENSFYDPDTPYEVYEAGLKSIPDDWDGSL